MFAFQSVSGTAPPWIAMRAARGVVDLALRDRAVARDPVEGRDATRGCAAAGAVAASGFGDSTLLPPIANTWSCDARPPPDEVGVPPTVIAMYSLPPAVKSVGPAAI